MGRVCPRHSHCGRPLNSVVSRHRIDREFRLLLLSAVRNHRGGESSPHVQSRATEWHLRLSDAPNPHQSRAVVSCQSRCGVRFFHRGRGKRSRLRSSSRVLIGALLHRVARFRCAVGHGAGCQPGVCSAGWWAGQTMTANNALELSVKYRGPRLPAARSLWPAVQVGR